MHLHLLPTLLFLAQLTQGIPTVEDPLEVGSLQARGFGGAGARVGRALAGFGELIGAVAKRDRGTRGVNEKRTTNRRAAKPVATTAVVSRRPAKSTSTVAASATTTSKTQPLATTATRTSSSNAAMTTTRAASCAPTYVAAIMISGTGTLPKPSSFVKKSSGQGLTLDGSNFRIVGPNIYWLCSDENTAPMFGPVDKGRIREALAIAVAMGGNTIRVLSCGITVGYYSAIEPSLGNFGSFDAQDYVIFAASQYGLRVIMTLTDDYDYYTGGKYTFLRFRGVDTSNFGNAFYSNQDVVKDFQAYVTQFVTHVNAYSKIPYAKDPAILAWETGNEMGAYIGKEGYPPASWTQGVISALKQHDGNHLIIDGSDGFYNYSTKATAPGLQIAGIDVMSDHGYPRNVALLNAQIPLAQSANKAFLIGEYDWTNPAYGSSLPDYLAVIEGQPYLGDMIWNVMGHDGQCCQFVPHNEVYSIYYPNGNTPDLQANILLVVRHWYKMTGRQPPASLPGVVCPQPVF